MFQQVVISGITVGAIYALIAIGFTIVFSTVRVVNFAHGEFVMVGGLLYAWLTIVQQIPLALAIPLAIAACVVVAWLSYELCLAGMNKDNHIAQVMVTLGLGVTIKGLAQVFIGKDTQFPPSFSSGSPLMLGSMSISQQSIWIVGSLAVLLGLLWAVMQKTRIGKGMRAVAINHYAAVLMGISPKRAAIIAFVFAGLIGGAAGALLSPVASAHYDNGMFLGIKGFAAAILGGLGHPIGALVGGLILGLVESLTAGYLSSAYKDAVSLVLLLAILLFRPQGLLGRALPNKL
ncbi:MAG: branched-chain amino acid ABC transporter permease [Betaproteobacteria bacterium]|nr:branched-chain amino acid ABC transporter permease [Betaproteobacteria bacterium]